MWSGQRHIPAIPPFERDPSDELEASDVGLASFVAVRVVAVDEPATTVTLVPTLPLAVMVRSGDRTVEYVVEYTHVDVRVSPPATL